MSTHLQAMIGAIKDNNVVNLQRAIADGADVNARIPNYISQITGATYRDATPLFIAIDMGHGPMAEWLIANTDADCLANVSHTTPLHRAAEIGLPLVIDAMAKRHVDLNHISGENWTPLAAAYKSGKETTLKALLNHGVDPNAGSVPAIVMTPTPNKPYLTLLLIDAGSDLSETWILSAGSTTRNVVEAHLERVNKKLKHSPGDGFPEHELIERNGTAKVLLNLIIGADKLPDLFSNERWQGREKDALKLYDKLAPLVPPYLRATYKSFDLTPLSTAAVENDEALTAVERYTRDAPHTRGRL